MTRFIRSLKVGSDYEDEELLAEELENAHQYYHNPGADMFFSTTLKDGEIIKKLGISVAELRVQIQEYIQYVRDKVVIDKSKLFLHIPRKYELVMRRNFLYKQEHIDKMVKRSGYVVVPVSEPLHRMAGVPVAVHHFELVGVGVDGD